MNLKKICMIFGCSSALFACSSMHEPGNGNFEDNKDFNKLQLSDNSGYSGDDSLKINGETPYGKIGGKYKKLLKETDKKGVTRMVTEVTREAGYRSAVGYANYAITSCVLKGEATLELDGKEPEYFDVGQCFIQPAGIKGIIYNDGKGVLKIISYSTTPEGEKPMVILEAKASKN